MFTIAEVKKIAEIGNEPFTTADAVGYEESCLSGQSGAEVKRVSSNSLEVKILSLTEKKNNLQSKSEEQQSMLAIKDSRIAELEISLTGEKFDKEESTCPTGFLDKNFNNVESELETLFRQKVEAEIEYLTITKTMQNLKAASACMLMEKQETVSGNKVQVPNNLEEAHSEGSRLKTRADEVDKYCGGILQVEESFTIQRRVFKLTFFLFFQFMWLILAILLVMCPFSSDYGVIIPT